VAVIFPPRSGFVQVEIPDAAPSDFPCPMCKYALMTSRPLERTRRLPSDSAPSWMRPWGYAFTIIGGLAFAVGVIREYSASRNPPMVAVIVGGLLNPILTLPTKVPSNSLGQRGGLGRIRSKPLSPMAL